MATSTLKFDADTTGWNGGIKKAIRTVQEMETACRKVAGTFEVVEKADLELVQSLGNMATSAKNAKGQFRELSDAALNLQGVYSRLTAEEKSSPFGQAMAQSINQLKGRAADLKDQMDDLNEELKHMASDTGFTDGVGMMSRTLGSCASAMVAFTGDSKELDVVIKDLAKIQTTVAAVEALTKAFQKQNLVMLKNPYVLAATAIAALGVAIYEFSTKENEAAAQIKMTDEAIKTQAQTLIDLQKIANGAASAIGNLTKSQAKAQYDSALEDLTAIQDRMKAQKAYVKQLEIARDAKKKEYEASGRTVQSNRLDGGVGATYDNEAYNRWKKYEQQVKDQTAVLEEMKKAAKEADAAVSTANAKYRRAQEDPTQTNVVTGGGGSTVNTEEITYAEDSIAGLTAKIKEYQAAQQLATNNDDWQTLEGKIQDAQSQIDQITGKAWEVKLPDEKDFSTASLGNFSSFASDLQKQMSEINITDSLYANLQEQLADTTALQNIIKTALENGLNFEEIGLDVEGLWSSLLNEEGIENCDWDAIVQKINEKLAEKGIQITFNANTGNIDQQSVGQNTNSVDDEKNNQKFDKALSSLNQLNSGINQVSSGLKAIGLDLGEDFNKVMNVFSGMLSIVSGVATIIQAIQTIKSLFEVPHNVAVEADLSAITAAVTSIAARSWLPFAEGGVVHAASGWVGGNSYVGDAIPALLNSGEVVLNASQQANLAEQIEAGYGGGGGNAQPYCDAETIYIGLNNLGRRNGWGELTFS